jgi:hypothetical protein
MAEITVTIERWKLSLCLKVSVGWLIARSSVAHKWRLRSAA